MEYILKTNGVSKKYKNRWVLRDVNMSIQRGDIYGFVGENGSGKTTIIRLITGLIFPNEGSFELFGKSNTSPDILESRAKIGAIVESPSIYLNMSARDNLKMQCDILGINDEEKIKSALAEVGLYDLYSDTRKAGNFSLGMRQRLGIAMALIGDVEFLILDEPMNGLDPAGIVDIRELIIRLNREKGITFLISSHILTELSLVATRYGIISHGKIIKEISSDELRNECRRSVVIEAEDRRALLVLLAKTIPVDDIVPVPNGARIYGDIDLNDTLSAVLESGNKILSVNCSESSIEDYYLSVTGGAHHA
ncbi:MAG: ATP-binding cassette domain-containing protein [Ruminococcaceae bacterium]|nr:ATP-binding cassette domain-containing protein [Oscillospiraceae bacterium]